MIEIMDCTFKIGSHDTMTYLKPKRWWLYPFRFIARCQRVSIEEQYEKYGIKLFDIRVKYNKKHKIWEFAHGSMVYKGKTPQEVFEFLNSKNEGIYIRLVLEYNSPVKNMDDISEYFVKQCIEWREQYSNLFFFEFRRKYDWKRLYTYDEMHEPTIYQAISSMTWKILDDWYPWLYAHSHNHDNIAQGTNKEYLLIDFVDIQ